MDRSANATPAGSSAPTGSSAPRPSPTATAAAAPITPSPRWWRLPSCASPPRATRAPTTPTSARLLLEHEDLALSRPTVRRILTRAGMPSPRRRRQATAPRVCASACHERGCCSRSTAAITPGSSSEARAFALLLAVDDATCAVVHALFRPAEDARGYFLLMEQELRCSGIPLALYSDRARRLPGLRPAARGRRGVDPVRAGAGGAGGPPELRPLTAGQGPGGAHGGHVPATAS